MATWATPGRGLPFCWSEAVSPTTKISGCREREIRLHLDPPRAISLYRQPLPCGDGVTPAVQITALLAIRSPATMTPSSSM